METIFFKVKDGRDITFTGIEVGYVHNPENDIAYRIFETNKGNWILTASSSENILMQHKIFENKAVDELVGFMGFSDLAKSLYNQLGIDTTQKLDF